MSKRRSDELKTGTLDEKNGEAVTEPSKRKELSAGVKKPKLAFSIGKKPTESKTLMGKDLKVKASLKAAFNSESEEEEEMPREARMKMRNIGRDTPTSAGPKSFGKTKHGFCDAKRVFEKNLKDAADNLDGDE